MIILRQSTASQEVPVGYFLDSTDGNTEETGLTIANTDIKVWKHGATTLANKNSGGATHISNGIYYVVLDATDTNTIGNLVLFVHVAGALAAKVNCIVLDENVYDVVFGTTALSTYAGGDTSGVTTLLSRIGTPADLGGGATVAQNLSDIEAQTDDIGAAGAGLTAVPWNAAWDAEVQSEATDALNAYDPPTKAELDAGFAALNNISTAQVNAEVDTALADIHLDHLLAADYDPASKPGVATALLNELIENDGGVSRYTANALEQAPTGGSAPTVEQIRQEMDSNSTQFAAIVADTNELQTDWANGGRLDTILDARASQTSLDTVDGIVDAILALLDDPRGEPGQGALPVNPDAVTKLDYLYKFLRNKKDNDGTDSKVYADDGTTVDHKQSTSSGGGIVTKGEWVTGP